MEKHILIIIALLSFSNLFSQTPKNDPAWTTFWEDNFNATTLNRTQNGWSHRASWGDCDNGAKLTDPAVGGQNHILNNGILDLVSKRETAICTTFSNPPTPNVYEQKDFTAGHILSKKAFKYGYFEIRCKIPQPDANNSYKGLSPTFWLFPSAYGLSGNYPNIRYSEIDIFEIDAETNYSTFNVHFAETNTPDYNGNSLWSLSKQELGVTNSTGSVSEFYRNVDFTDNGAPDYGYHKFGCEWNPNYISFYIDDKLVYTTQMKYIDENGVEHQFTDKLIPMNFWIGTATPAGNFVKPIDANTVLPYDYLVDYVRVYRLDMTECGIDYYSNTDPNYSNYNHKIKKEIFLSDPIPANNDFSFRAVDGITLNDGFEVPMGSTVYINTSECIQYENGY